MCRLDVSVCEPASVVSVLMRETRNMWPHVAQVAATAIAWLHSRDAPLSIVDVSLVLVKHPSSHVATWRVDRPTCVSPVLVKHPSSHVATWRVDRSIRLQPT